jgi:hypothetical protein
LVNRLGEEEWGPWVGAGLKIAARSAVAAVRYFRESPQLFAEIEAVDLRRLVIACADQCAERDAGLALELLRQAPAVIRLLPSEPAAGRSESVRRWAELGGRLASQDSILASEYFKQSAPFLLHLPASALQIWAELGGTLVQPNQLGKPDYLPALEYFRVSPEWLGAIAPSELRSDLLTLVRALTDESPDRRVSLLKQAPQWLQAVPSASQRQWLLERVRSLAAESPSAAVALLSKGGELVRRFLSRGPQAGPAHNRRDDSSEQEWRRRLDEWVLDGRQLLRRSPGAGLAYFRLESSAAEQSLDHAAGGLSLRQVARTLMLFAEGLSGHPLTIKPIERGPVGSDEAEDRSLPAQLPFREGRTIFLPPFVSEFGSPDENFRYYKVMTAYQAAQLEFGAFEVDRAALIELARPLFGEEHAARVASAFDGRAGQPLEQFFSASAAPALANDLWKIAEGARIDAALRRAYPGLRGDLDLVAGYTLFLRPTINPVELTLEAIEAGRGSGLSTVEQVVELLLQLSMAGRTNAPIPSALEPLLIELGGLLQRVQQPEATAADSLRAACDCCLLLTRRLTGGMERFDPPAPTSAQASANPLGQAGATIGQGEPGDYRALTDPQYRGRQGAQRGPSAAVPLGRSAAQQQPPSVSISINRTAPHQPDQPSGGDSAQTTAGESLPDASPTTGLPALAGMGTADRMTRMDGGIGLFAYPEWDESIQDYRQSWCTVREQAMAAPTMPARGADSGAVFVERTRAAYRGQLLLLRNMFERLRPDRFKKLRRQEAGEEIDLDAAIEAVIDRRVGRTPSSKLYMQRDRRDRDVAVALLVDVSGSTGKLLGSGSRVQGSGSGEPSASRSIIQVEKESVFLLAEAVQAVGDALAVYAYSGNGRDRVDFYLVKEFDEPYGPRIGERISAMTALVQNRDGTAIRHATRKLLRQEAKTRLLLWLSDGRPFDRDYEGVHALADTRRAIVEAQRARVRTFCITVDRRGEEYQAAVLAPNQYTVIDDVRQLPERLPRIYQRVTT